MVALQLALTVPTFVLTRLRPLGVSPALNESEQEFGFDWVPAD